MVQQSVGFDGLNDDSDERDKASLWHAHDAQDGGNSGDRQAGGVADDDGGSLRPELTKGQLLRIASGMLGLMFGWATKTVLTTPLFRDVYGVDPADLGYVWVAGPLSGLVVQPVVGVISDHREGHGQRSFFFAAGTVVMAVSLALLPAAGAVCRRLAGSSSHQQEEAEEDEKAGTSLAVAALWSLDLAMNASLVAIRAVVADCAPPRQQPEANTLILVSYGAGTLLGYGFGAVDAASWLGLPPGAFWKSCVEFWVAALVLLLASAVATREAYQLERPQGPHFATRRGLSSYAAVERRENHEWWRQRGRHGGRNGGSGGDGGGGDDGCGTAAVSGALMNSPSINADATAGCCREGGNNGGEGGEGGGAGACAATGGDEIDAIDGRGREERGGRWYEPPPPEAAAATAAHGASGAVADLRRVGDAFVSIAGGGDGSTRGAADGFSAEEGGDGEACSEDGVTTAGVEGAGGVEASPLPPTSFKWLLFYDVPGWLLPVCLLVLHAWVGWFAIIIFGSDWVGVNVFGGDPSAGSDDERRQAYEDGVSWASLGLALQAIVVTLMGCGPVTCLVRFAGFRGAFLAGVVVQVTCLLCASFLRPNTAGRVLSLGVFAALGIPLALVESLPYMMVGMFSPHDKHGQLLGKLNVWIVLAQLALTLCVHPIVQHSRRGDGPVMLAGAVAAAVGVVFVPFIGRGGTATAPSTPTSFKAMCRTGDQSPPSPCRVLLPQEGD